MLDTAQKNVLGQGQLEGKCLQKLRTIYLSKHGRTKMEPRVWNSANS